MHQTPAAAISKGIPLSEAELQQRKNGGFDGDWTVWSMKNGGFSGISWDLRGFDGIPMGLKGVLSAFKD